MQKDPASQQQTLFDDIESLPLFSGTAIRFEQPEASGPGSSPYRQESFSACETCHDTGKVGDRYCWCKAGQEARAFDQELAETREAANRYARAYRGVAVKGRVNGLEL